MEPRDKHPLEPDYALREPDLILTFDQYSFERNREQLESLTRGDYVVFNATISHLGVQSKERGSVTKYHANDEESTHHMHAHSIKKVPNKRREDISPHIHWDGRFKFNQDLQV